MSGNETRRNALRWVLCWGMSALIGATWGLWVETGAVFPTTPWVRGWPAQWFSGWGGTVWVITGMVVFVVAGWEKRPGWANFWMAASLVWLAAAVLGDQNRLQAWVYQYAVFAAILLGLRRQPELSLGFCRLVLIALYVHSGVSKLDLSFAEEIGHDFLKVLGRPLGLDPDHYSVGVRHVAALSLPAAELLIGCALAFSSTRRAAMILAVVMHLTLIGILGPWSLGHSWGVLTWNALLIAQVIILFGNVPPAKTEAIPGERIGETCVRILVLAVVLMPLGERVGLWDSWPSFALYAGHCERSEIGVHRADWDRLPENVRVHARIPKDIPSTSNASVPTDMWIWLDMTAWSRAAHGSPIYPQNRVYHGIVQGLALGKADGDGRELIRVRVRHWRRATIWTGERVCDDLADPDAMARYSARFWLPSRP